MSPALLRCSAPQVPTVLSEGKWNRLPEVWPVRIILITVATFHGVPILSQAPHTHLIITTASGDGKKDHVRFRDLLGVSQLLSN